MEGIDLIARIKVHPDRKNTFIDWAERIQARVREKDVGTLRYDWYHNQDRSEWVVLESYIDSQAVLQHFANVGDLLEESGAFSDVEGEVYGNPTTELVEALAPLGMTVYSRFV